MRQIEINPFFALLAITLFGSGAALFIVYTADTAEPVFETADELAEHS